MHRAAGAGCLGFLFAGPLRALLAALAAEEALEQVVVAATAAAEELGHLLGALFIGGAATAADWADEDGVRSSREAITIPTASEATMIKNE